MPPSGTSVQPGVLETVAREGFCFASQDPDEFVRVAGDTLVIPSIRGTIALRNLVKNNPQTFARIVNTARSFICNELPPGPDAGGPSAPFTGGQCSFRYNVGFSFTYDRDGVQEMVSRDPLTAILDGPLSLETVSYTERFIVDSNGATIGFNISDPDEVTNLQGNWIVFPNDGQPDDCGNPPDQIEPPEPGSNTTPVTVPVTEPNGDPGSEPGDLVFGPPYVGDDGCLRFPVSISFSDDAEIQGEFNACTGDFNNTPGGPDVSVECCDDSPLEEEPEGEEGEDELVVVGAKVVATVNASTSQASVLPGPPGGPDLYVPDIGALTFVVETTPGTLTFSTTTRLKTLSQFVEAPIGAVSATVVPRPGVTYQVTLVRRATRVEDPVAT